MAKEKAKLIKDRRSVLNMAGKKLSFCASLAIILKASGGAGITPVCLNAVSATIHQIAIIIINAKNDHNNFFIPVPDIKETILR
jgi:phage-related protein